MSATRNEHIHDHPAVSAAGLDIEAIRGDFPILHRPVHGKPLAFLDNAASTQKPEAVISAVADFYRGEYANIHRGVYHLSEVATARYEAAREAVRAFINAASLNEVIFTAGTTDSINLVAHSWGREFLTAGDEILITGMEHHANIVPWQLLGKDTGARLKVVPFTDDGDIELDTFADMLTERTRLVSVVHISNSLGTVNPVREIIRLAHERDIPVLIDGAQAIPHMTVDVQELDADFYAFSGHKMYGPTGVGVLYGKEALLERMRPYRGGGDMIRTVTFEETTFNELPHRFEAGTPNIAGVVGTAAAIAYLQQFDREAVAAHEQDLLAYAEAQLGQFEELRLIGHPRERAGAISFVIDTIHSHDVGTWLDRAGVAIRTGHHCTQPVMDRYGVPATSRLSVAIYNRREDIDALVSGLRSVFEVFG